MNRRSEFTIAKLSSLGWLGRGWPWRVFSWVKARRLSSAIMASAEKLQSEITAVAGLPVDLVLGGHPSTLLDGCDLLCLSGGVPPQIEIVQMAMDRGIRLSNDSLLTLQRARQLGLGPIVAITGSSGKTTTTTLVGLC